MLQGGSQSTVSEKQGGDMKGMLSKGVENNIKHKLQLHLAMHDERERRERTTYLLADDQEQTWKKVKMNNLVCKTHTQISFKLRKIKLEKSEIKKLNR